MYKYDKLDGYAIGDRVVVHPRDKKNRKSGVVVEVYYNFYGGLFGVEIDGREYICRASSLKHQSIDKFDKLINEAN